MAELKPSILITGGSGFIGSHVARKAVERGFSVTCTKRPGSKIIRPVEMVEYLEIDFLSQIQVQSALVNRNFNYVVNLMGSINHTSFFGSGHETFRTHFLGTQYLVSALEQSELKRFIQIGSSDEYGNATAPQNEDIRESPQTPYSLAKTAATHLIQMLNRSDDFPGTVLRPFLVYGPDQDPQRLIPSVIKCCLTNQEIALSSGEQIRDFLYIDDAVEALFACLLNGNLSGEVLNLGSGEGITVREVASLIRQIIGQGTLVFGSRNSEKIENPCLVSSTEKIRRLTGWCPKTDLYAGLTKTIDSYRRMKI